MKTLKRIRYYTMNSWNLSKSLAYNLKVYNIIDSALRNKVYALMDTQQLWDHINELMYDFDVQFNYQWQAGFNGRSGGYLVLYRGGINNGRAYSQPGRNISEDEVPSDVKKAFRQLAVDIVKTTEYLAKNFTTVDEKYTVEKTRKVLQKI